MQYTFEHWDLKEIINAITDKFPIVTKIFLFGSRAYKTNSTRSDIDLLFCLSKPIPNVLISEWLNNTYPPVDFFKTMDMQIAESVINGSAVANIKKATLKEELDAIELWDKNNGFSVDFTDWVQKTRKGLTFELTQLPLPFDIAKAINAYNQILDENNLPNTNLGMNWKEIGEKLSKFIEIALETPGKWTRGKDFKSISLSGEYDFQNFIDLILKPWFPSLEREVPVAWYDGQKKTIDFSINWNSILIEAKYVEDANTEAKALKELEGVKLFYKSNTVVELLMFWILVDKNYPLDRHKIEKDYTDIAHRPIIITRVFKV